MRTSISPDPRLVYIPLNISICMRTFQDACRSCERSVSTLERSTLEVRRCTTKFSHLAHMRRRRSPVPMQVYIPVNSSICMRTLPQVYSSCESWKSWQSIVSCLKSALKVLWKCADVPRNSPTFHTCAEGDHLFQCKCTSQWTVLYA